MKVFVVDQKYCNGCYGCQIACKDEHCGNDWMPYQKPQPELGHFWMKLKETTHGQVPRVKLEYRPYMCQHCDNCPLVEHWPSAASRREDGIVVINPETSKGIKEMVDACPYGAVYWNEALEIPQKCDACAHLVDAGEKPHCVDFCPTEALKFGDEEDFAAEIAKATRLDVAGTSTRVYYLNTPGLFIGGGVWNSDDDEVIIGAKVKLTYPDGTVAETVTDDFGDFWFRQLSEGDYKLDIQADGYAGVQKDVKLDKSLNVGDFDLAKA